MRVPVVGVQTPAFGLMPQSLQLPSTVIGLATSAWPENRQVTRSAVTFARLDERRGSMGGFLSLGLEPGGVTWKPEQQGQCRADPRFQPAHPAGPIAGASPILKTCPVF